MIPNKPLNVTLVCLDVTWKCFIEDINITGPGLPYDWQQN